MLKQRNLTLELADLLYSLPYVAGPEEGCILDRQFYRFSENYRSCGRLDKERDEIFGRIFLYQGFNVQTEKMVWEWIDVSWVVWLEFCWVRGRKPGQKPVREGENVTDIEEIVF